MNDAWRANAPIALAEVDLSRPVEDAPATRDARIASVLVRLSGTPVGVVDVPVVDGACPAELICDRINTRLAWEVASVRLRQLVAGAAPLRPYRIDDLLIDDPGALSAALDTSNVTVAVCTRDRPEGLARTLESLAALDAPCEVLVIDNAPTTDATERLVRRFPGVRYVREPRRGLDWARNRAIVEARGEIVAFTDDDVVVDPGWVSGLAPAFAADPNVMAVTGLVVPYELQTDAQVWFERYGGFGRGYRRRWIRAEGAPDGARVGSDIGTGMFGTGANMAFRRTVFADVGLFDPALDVGTATGGAGDLDMMFRVLKAGWTLVYEPRAMVRHRHRRSIPELRRQIRQFGGLVSYLQAAVRREPDEARAARRVMLRWYPKHHAARLVHAVAVPGSLPPALVLDEIRGQLGAYLGRRYRRAVAEAARIERTVGPVDSLLPTPPPRPRSGGVGMAVRTVDLRAGITDLSDLGDASSVRCFVCDGPTPVGAVDIWRVRGFVSRVEVADVIVEQLGFGLIDAQERDVGKRQAIEAAAWAAVQSSARPAAGSHPTTTTPRAPRVAVVIATKDRPDDLRQCLASLEEQVQRHGAEIIVCDNHPVSGRTPPVVAEFPSARLVAEPRSGAAYARNRGVLASDADVLAMIDDDAVAAPDWIDRLLPVFSRQDVMAVTGNILPVELATPAQQAFERHQPLGRGFQRWEVDAEWFRRSWRAVPTWDLGGTCNLAFRRAAVTHPEIGLFDEALGTGMPTGCGEDSYFLYRVLKAGFTVVYEPTAVVWHRHRNDRKSLHRQLHGYYRGAPAHQLATLQRDGDLRSLGHLGAGLPAWFARGMVATVLKRSDKPMALWCTELAGFAAGTPAYVQARLRVRRWGPSTDAPWLTEESSSRPTPLPFTSEGEMADGEVADSGVHDPREGIARWP